jgi:leucyl aminopeptidase
MAMRTSLAFLLAAAFAVPVGASAAGPRKQAPVDAFKPVYVLTSTAQARLLPSPGKTLALRTDKVGRRLALLELKQHQVDELSAAIHDREDRCGGFFAFESRAEAEQFLQADQTAAVMGGKLGPFNEPLRIDNGAVVAPALAQVDAQHIANMIWTLSTSYPNRYYASINGTNAALAIRDYWMGLAGGRTDVSSEMVGCATCGVQSSVVLTIRGSTWPDEIVVLGAHLDSISNVAYPDGERNAPGADDDASGIAVLSDVLRIAMANGWRPRRTVKFMGYAAEEVGLRGSRAIAQAYAAEGRKVVGVLQLDMTNYKTGPIDMRLVTDFSSPVMQQYVVGLFDTYLAPLGHTRGTIACGYACSDHASWTQYGFPSAFMFEPGAGTTSLSDDFPYIHTPNDTLANMGYSTAPSLAFSRLGLAFMGELADVRTPVSLPLPSNRK